MALSEKTAAPKIDEILAAQNICGFEAPGGTDKQTIHSYGPVYETLLSPLTDKACTILEVGVAHGGSMLLWHELCPKARIIGMDIQNAVHPSIFPRMKPERFAFLMGDAYNDYAVGQVKAVTPDGIDFAIDDGPHSLESQQRFLQLYVPLLNPGGIAVIEDIQDYGWLDSLLPLVPEGFSSEVVDIRNVKGRYDDLMLVLKRK